MNTTGVIADIVDLSEIGHDVTQAAKWGLHIMFVFVDIHC